MGGAAGREAEEWCDLADDPGEQVARSPAPAWARPQAALPAATGWPVGDGWRLGEAAAPQPQRQRRCTALARLMEMASLDPQAGLSQATLQPWLTEQAACAGARASQPRPTASSERPTGRPRCSRWKTPSSALPAAALSIHDTTTPPLGSRRGRPASVRSRHRPCWLASPCRHSGGGCAQLPRGWWRPHWPYLRRCQRTCRPVARVVQRGLGLRALYRQACAAAWMVGEAADGGGVLTETSAD